MIHDCLGTTTAVGVGNVGVSAVFDYVQVGGRELDGCVARDGTDNYRFI